jgi:hypothetical protein
VISSALPYVVVTAATGLGLLTTATTTDTSTNLAPYVGGSAGVIAVAALGEVTRRLLNGRLIPRETRETEAEMGAYIVAAGQREDRAMKVVEDSNRIAKVSADDVKQHNARLASELAEVTERQQRALMDEMATLVRAVQDLRDEIRADRRRDR